MVRFQAASGNVAAKLVARGKHFVLFDEPADKGAILKESYPDLGWTTSIEGHPTLPYSVAWRLFLRGGAERDRRDVLLFSEFATAQLFARIWKAVVPTFNFTADNDRRANAVLVSFVHARDQRGKRYARERLKIETLTPL